jgi:hypothetical protein
MSKTGKTSSKPNSEQAILAAITAQPEMTAAEVAGVAKLGRSTASKVLARLADSGKVARVRGGRDGARRLPDRFSLSGKPTRATKRQAAGAATNGSGGERLKPGQLDGLVIAFLKKNDDSAPHSPTGVANALQRSSGAVGNCLVRLARAKQVRQDSDKPRRYSLAA